MKLLQKGDDSAFEIIYNKHWESMYAMAYNRLRSREVAEGIIQDIFTDLWVKRQDLTIYKSLTSYLFSALKYKTLNVIAHQSVRRKYIQEQQPFSVSYKNSTDDTLSFNELYELISQTIDELPKKCRLVFRLKYDENYSTKQIADELDISPRTVETHVGQAKKILKSKLTRYLGVSVCLLLSL
ncbi:RNA polymerase sigma-70 factor [Fulvivirga sp. M361]|uniref:RNA polymerase sigma-70 factor n=1 Tax=Fulvivirga sp. M361 TaxID=2594266 RepID=UPI001623E11A|nr:RNA polymerase sigma-70 factor [Fulvivirga sp. M361]